MTDRRKITYFFDFEFFAFLDIVHQYLEPHKVSDRKNVSLRNYGNNDIKKIPSKWIFCFHEVTVDSRPICFTCVAPSVTSWKKIKDRALVWISVYAQIRLKCALINSHLFNTCQAEIRHFVKKILTCPWYFCFHEMTVMFRARFLPKHKRNVEIICTEDCLEYYLYQDIKFIHPSCIKEVEMMVWNFESDLLKTNFLHVARSSVTSWKKGRFEEVASKRC